MSARTDQILPPGIGGYSDAKIYPLRRSLEKIEQPVGGASLQSLSKQPGSKLAFVLGQPSIPALLPEIIQFVDTGAHYTPEMHGELAKILSKIEFTVHDDLDGNGVIGGAPAKPPAAPSLYRYSIPAFDVSFTGPAANVSPTVTDHFTTDTGCGEPAKDGWAISSTTTGLAVAPTHNIANFSRQNPFLLFTHKFDRSGTPTGEIKILLRYRPSPPQTITVETAKTGDITRINNPPGPLPVTLTKVSSC